MSVAKKTKARVRMIEMGIVPAFTGNELTNMLDSLSEKERRVAKRKFRKAWRKVHKNDKTLTSCLSENSHTRPTKRELRNRAVWVISDVIQKIKD